MKTAAIREKLHAYLEDVDDSKIKALYTLLRDDIDDSNEFTLTEEHKRILDEEHALHMSGKSKSYSWEEAKEIIRGKRSF